MRHQIGFVSNNTAVYDRMTAWEMVEYFGRLYGIDADSLRERMESLMEEAGTEIEPWLETCLLTKKTKTESRIHTICGDFAGDSLLLNLITVSHPTSSSTVVETVE